MAVLSDIAARGIAISRHGRMLAAFAAVYIIWGSTYLACALGLRSIPPLLLMGVRSLVAGAIMLGMDRLQRPEPLPQRLWLPAIAGGLLLFAACNGTVAYVQQQVPSGVAAVVLGTIPFWVLLLGFVFPGKARRSPWILLGLIPGLAGVALIAWPSGGATHSPLSPMLAVILLGAAFCWAGGTLVSRRFADHAPPILLGGLQLVIGGAALVLLGALAGEFSKLSLRDITGASWFGLAYLAIAGSVIAFTAYLWLLERVSAPLATTYTFVNPIIAVILGWALLSEQLNARMLLGSALVIGAVIAIWHFEAPREYH